MRKNKLFLLLALLLTAATGAWAQDAKHLITAKYREQTRSLEQPLPYATTIGELYEAVTGGQSFSDLISSMSAVEMPLTGITSRNTSVVSIGELNGASTPVTVIADGEATISIKFGSYAHGIFVSATSPLYAYMKDGVKDADKWTVKVGDGQAQALPIGGLKGDGSETVTLQYTGRLKVKGVKATSDAAAASVPVETITLNKTATTIEVGNNETLSVSSITPDNATDQTVTWSSDNEAVATVDADGKVTAVAAGTAIITATAHDGSEVTATCSVSVTPAYYSKMTSCGSSGYDQIMKLKELGRGRTSYNSSLTAAQAWELAKYRATVDGKTTYVIMSSQDEGFEIHYALSTDAAATEHTGDSYDLADPFSSTILNMYYIAQ